MKKNIKIENTKVQTLESLARLENLEHLTIKGNLLTDWSPLLKLKKLKFLIFNSSEFSEKHPVAIALEEKGVALLADLN
jgi:Leucine-rich repeat (LRR) protein